MVEGPEGGMARGTVREEAIYNCMYGNRHLEERVVKTQTKN